MAVSKVSIYNIFFTLIAIFFLIASNLFYLVGYSHQVPDKHFTGVNIMSASDKLVYFSQIEQGRQGQIMMKNLHTSEPQKGLWFAPHWWLIGQTANVLQLSTEVAYQLFRVLLSIIFLLCIALLSQRLLADPTERLLATTMVLFSSGWGWLWALVQPSLLANHTNLFLTTPVDIYLTEMAPLSNSQQSPLFILSHILLILIMYLFIRWRSHWQWQRYVIIAGLAFFLVVLHPYDLWIVAAVLFLWTLVKAGRGNYRFWLPYGYVLLGLAAGAIYVYAGLRSEIALSGWSAQNLVYSPPLYTYFIGLGLLLPLWLVGISEVRRRYPDNAWWLWMLIWSGSVWFLMYLPLDYNRRLTNAWQIPLGYVAYLGLRWLVQRGKNFVLQMIIIFVASTFLALGSFYSIYLPIKIISEYETDERFFQSDDLSQALSRLKSITTAKDVILASDADFGLMIPAYTGRRVYVGHKHQTVNFLTKNQLSDEFWSGVTGMERQNFLQQTGITYLVVLYDSDYSADYFLWLRSADYLESVVDNKTVAIYRVIK